MAEAWAYYSDHAALMISLMLYLHMIEQGFPQMTGQMRTDDQQSS